MPDQDYAGVWLGFLGAGGDMEGLQGAEGKGDLLFEAVGGCSEGF